MLTHNIETFLPEAMTFQRSEETRLRIEHMTQYDRDGKRFVHVRTSRQVINSFILVDRGWFRSNLVRGMRGQHHVDHAGGSHWTSPANGPAKNGIKCPVLQ